MQEKLKSLFCELNSRIEQENASRRIVGAPLVGKSQIEILGQTSLLIQPELTLCLSLAQTGDLDAKLRADNFVRATLKGLLLESGLMYDEDSPLIFVPPDSRFFEFLELPNLSVTVIDPESALVSKAVKAPEKNIQLVRQAIASGNYPNLVSRIDKLGGDLSDFT